MSGVADALRDLSRLFRERGIRWYVFGAQAVVVHGRPRMTADIDVTADISDEILGELATSLGNAGFAAREKNIEAFARRTRVLPFVHEKTRMPTDIVLAGPGLEQEFLDRAGTVRIEGNDIPFISAEDLIVSKLLAGRPKDMEDIRGILLAQGTAIDDARILETLRRLEEALDRSDFISALDSLR